jgi:DinB superfamily
MGRVGGSALKRGVTSSTRSPDRARAALTSAGPDARATVEQIGPLHETTKDTGDIDAKLERVAADFHDLVGSASPAELCTRTKGTKWTNKQLLFHMLFGFVLVRVLLILVKGFGRLPAAVAAAFAAVLNAGTRPFHLVNYLVALPGGRILGVGAMSKLMDHTIGHLRTSLGHESERNLALAMHFPIGWDPYFKDVMTVADVYYYPTQHYDHHRRQLTTRRALER